jgi:hypothetical protein
VLKTIENFESTSSNAMLLNIEVDKSYEIGDVIQTTIPNIYGVMFENNRPLSQQQEMIESINVFNEYDSVLKKTQQGVELKFFSGQTFKITNTEYGLKYKVKMMIDVYSQLYDFIGKSIKTSSGEIVELTEENLKNSTILIANYYDYTTHSENECYFNIFLNEKDG